jgi:hypothetical protein
MPHNNDIHLADLLLALSLLILVVINVVGSSAGM